MTFLERLLGLFQKSADSMGGVYPASVVNNNDPNGSARVLVKLASGQPQNTPVWARTSTLMAGNQRGTWFMPEVDDEVLVAFEGGNPGRPIVVGALWNSSAPPPEQMDSNNSRKSIVTRSGVRIMIEETDKASVLVLQTPAGQSLVLEDADQNSVHIKDANGNSIVLSASGITIHSPGKVTVQANTVEIQASKIDVATGMADFSGVVKCDTLIANSVVASSYTPGAGNIW
jgi:uncharacterized protein involved in type VI secretion and phage assembly